MNSRWRVLVLGAVAAVPIAACGSSDSANGSSESTAGTPASGGEDSFCRAVDEFRTGMADLDPSLSPAQRTERLNGLSAGLADRAPDSLEKAIATIEAADPTSPADIDSDEYQAAIGELGEYIESECGLATDP